MLIRQPASAQVDLEAQTRQVADREAAAAEHAAALKQRAGQTAQAEREVAAGREALELAVAAQVRSSSQAYTFEAVRVADKQSLTCLTLRWTRSLYDGCASVNDVIHTIAAVPALPAVPSPSR